MLRRLGHTAVAAAAPLGQAQQRIDPVVDIALTTAGQLLAQNDPGARETETLVRRIIQAPPPWWSGHLPSSGKPGIAKVSDVNPFLRPIVFAAENPTTTALGIVAIPVLAFLLGRMSVRPARAAA